MRLTRNGFNAEHISTPQAHVMQRCVPVLIGKLIESERICRIDPGRNHRGVALRAGTRTVFNVTGKEHRVD